MDIYIWLVNEIPLSIIRHSGFTSSSDYNVYKGFWGLFYGVGVWMGKCRGEGDKAESGQNNMSTHDIQK